MVTSGNDLDNSKWLRLLGPRAGPTKLCPGGERPRDLVPKADPGDCDAASPSTWAWKSLVSATPKRSSNSEHLWFSAVFIEVPTPRPELHANDSALQWRKALLKNLYNKKITYRHIQHKMCMCKWIQRITKHLLQTWQIHAVLTKRKYTHWGRKERKFISLVKVLI